MVINATSHDFLFSICIMNLMSGGMWVVLVIPAVLAFLFGVWVFYNMVADVSQREESPFTIVGPDTIRMKIEPPG